LPHSNDYSDKGNEKRNETNDIALHEVHPAGSHIRKRLLNLCSHWRRLAGNDETSRIQGQGDSKMTKGSCLITMSNRGPGGPMYGIKRHCPLN
jgi:hypothetical protein